METFHATHENVETGKICYLANTWIEKSHRNSWVYKQLKLDFFRQNWDCEYFVGEARRKKTAPLKVFKKSEIMSLMKMKNLEGVINHG
jgi:hypothetical protein